jgi:CBS domain-containing protein
MTGEILTDRETTGLPPIQTRWSADSLAGNLDELLAAFDYGLPVRLIATFQNLVTCGTDDIIADALELTLQGDFDYLPVTENGLFVGLFDRAYVLSRHPSSSDRRQRVRAAMHNLDETNLMSSEAGILSFMDSALERPCRLLLNGEHISGIVTTSDLCKFARNSDPLRGGFRVQ